MAEALKVNRVLTTLNLSSNRLTNDGTDMTGIYAIADALKVNGVLTTLKYAFLFNLTSFTLAPLIVDHAYFAVWVATSYAESRPPNRYVRSGS